MPTLSSKLPWDHQYAAGYSSCVGYQCVPTDPDAIDYLTRVAAADGAGVEVGVAMAVDTLIKGCKSDGIWDAIKASCLLCGPRTLAGALVPLVGTAPTSYAFASGDYNRVTGLKGDGSTTYLDSGRAGNADGQDDAHLAVYASSIASGSSALLAAFTNIPSAFGKQIASDSSQNFFTRFNTGTYENTASFAAGFAGASRSDSDRYYKRNNSTTTGVNDASTGVSAEVIRVFASAVGQYTDARLAFYSIGSALDLAALDTHISRYVAGIQFYHNTGLSPHQYDDATISYINAGYAAGGTL